MTDMVNWSLVTNASSLLAAPNQITSGLFWSAMLAMFMFIVVMSLMPYGWEAAILTGSAVSTMLAILMKSAGLISYWMLFFIAGILLITGFVIYGSSTREKG